MQRLDLKTIRFDAPSDSVLIDGRSVTMEISRQAIEALAQRQLTDEELVRKAAEEEKRLNRIANIIPADDGKINVTERLLAGDGQFVGPDEGER